MRAPMTSITGSWAIVSLFWAVTLRNVVPTATVVKDGIALMVNVQVICVPLRLIAEAIASVITESVGILVAIRETATTMEWVIYANMDFVSVPLERNADIHIQHLERRRHDRKGGRSLNGHVTAIRHRSLKRGERTLQHRA